MFTNVVYTNRVRMAFFRSQNDMTTRRCNTLVISLSGTTPGKPSFLSFSVNSDRIPSISLRRTAFACFVECVPMDTLCSPLNTLRINCNRLFSIFSAAAILTARRIGAFCRHTIAHLSKTTCMVFMVRFIFNRWKPASSLDWFDNKISSRYTTMRHRIHLNCLRLSR